VRGTWTRLGPPLARFWQTYRTDVMLAALLFAAALTLRLPYLMLVPHYTDEGVEVLWGLDIALGRHYPLTAVDAYDGPLFAYLMAALFKVFGLHLLLPRLMAALAGAATVVLTYGLARVMWPARTPADRRWARLAGLVAAALTATCPILTAWSSHYGWSSALTPLFATATVLAIYAGATGPRPGLLALGGLLAACTLQTHPTSFVVLLGLGIWLVTRDRARPLWQRVPYQALALFLVGYSPMIWANARLDSPLLREAVARPYAFAPTLALDQYTIRAAKLIAYLLYVIGGGLPPATLASVVSRAVLTFLLLAGSLLMIRRANGSLALIFATALLLLPIFLKSLEERYTASLVPLGYVAIGIAAADLFRFLSASRGRGALIGLRWRQAGGILAALLLALLISSPIYTLAAYYRDLSAHGQTNEAYFHLRDLVSTGGACGPNLFLVDTATGGTYPLAFESLFAVHSLDYVLTLEGCPHLLVSPQEIRTWLARGRDGWIIVPAQGMVLDSSNLQAVTTVFAATSFAATRDAPTVPLTLYHATGRP